MIDASTIKGTRIPEVLVQSQTWGFLGPGDVSVHVDHSLQFASAMRDPQHVLDLGSGGGVPGLILAVAMVQTEFTLLDTNVRRCAFLRTALEDLDLSERVTVLEGRAEDLARVDEFRGAFDTVVARSFGPPAVVAECAVGFMTVGARLIVSEPPIDPAVQAEDDRWNEAGLAQLGLQKMDRVTGVAGTVQVLVLDRSCPDRFPRRNGVPAKRPLF